jgi:hypothetical protein
LQRTSIEIFTDVDHLLSLSHHTPMQRGCMLHTAQCAIGHIDCPSRGVCWSQDRTVPTIYLIPSRESAGPACTTSGIGAHPSLRFGSCPAECGLKSMTVGSLLHALRATTNFSERRTGEVRRTPLPRTPMNRPCSAASIVLGAHAETRQRSPSRRWPECTAPMPRPRG